MYGKYPVFFITRQKEHTTWIRPKLLMMTAAGHFLAVVDLPPPYACPFSGVSVSWRNFAGHDVLLLEHQAVGVDNVVVAMKTTRAESTCDSDEALAHYVVAAVVVDIESILVSRRLRFEEPMGSSCHTNWHLYIPAWVASVGPTNLDHHHHHVPTIEYQPVDDDSKENTFLWMMMMIQSV
jgi:hypothetical protein